MHQGQQRSQQWELPVIGFGHAGAAGHRTAAAGAAMRVGGVQAALCYDIFQAPDPPVDWTSRDSINSSWQVLQVSLKSETAGSHILPTRAARIVTAGRNIHFLCKSPTQNNYGKYYKRQHVF